MDKDEVAFRSQYISDYCCCSGKQYFADEENEYQHKFNRLNRRLMCIQLSSKVLLIIGAALLATLVFLKPDALQDRNRPPRRCEEDEKLDTGCACPPDHEVSIMGEQYCSEDGKKLCSDLGNMIYDKETKSCQPCPSKTIFDKTTFKCTCDSDHPKFNEEENQCQACQANSTYNAGTNQCECNSDFPLLSPDGTTCSACPMNSIFNAQTSKCQCTPEFPKLSEDKSKCEACDPNHEYIEASNACRCKAEHVVNKDDDTQVCVDSPPDYCESLSLEFDEAESKCKHGTLPENPEETPESTPTTSSQSNNNLLIILLVVGAVLLVAAALFALYMKTRTNAAEVEFADQDEASEEAFVLNQKQITYDFAN